MGIADFFIGDANYRAAEGFWNNLLEYNVVRKSEFNAGKRRFFHGFELSYGECSGFYKSFVHILDNQRTDRRFTRREELDDFSDGTLRFLSRIGLNVGIYSIVGKFNHTYSGRSLAYLFASLQYGVSSDYFIMSSSSYRSIDVFLNGFATDLTTLYSANRNICEPIRKRVRSIAERLTDKDKKKLLQGFAGKF
ncbi:hypothetical protein HYX02_04025 [Candidatus Woesearchaeota archaeon]|nr:hypothetical protein [Candidatus Woesearchaeota archaeon]